MRSGIYLVLAFAASALAAPTHKLAERAVTVDQLFGYATQNGGTTGGAGVLPPRSVTSLSALRAAVSGTSRKIVRISGIIRGDGDTVDVGSYTTVIGVGANSGLTGGGFRVINSQNVIIRNLKVSLSLPELTLSSFKRPGTEFWNALTDDKDYHDGATDITHGSDFITISWNKYHDTHKTSLIGHSDSNEAEDRGRLRVTMHHNSYVNVSSRIPSLRFGTGHFYNNVARNVIDSGVNSRLGAQMLVERSVFDNARNAIQTNLYGGYVYTINNIYSGTTTYDPINPGTLLQLPYSYTLDPVATVDAQVSTYSGTGIINA